MKDVELQISQIQVERVTFVSSRPFAEIVTDLEKAVGHPDMHQFNQGMLAAQGLEDVENLVNRSISERGFMEFTRFNMGLVLQSEIGPNAPKIQRFVIGNPLVMKEMAKHVHDAASYAPVTILIDERPDGVHFTYDRMASFLASYQSPEALAVAVALDKKIEALLAEIA